MLLMCHCLFELKSLIKIITPYNINRADKHFRARRDIVFWYLLSKPYRGCECGEDCNQINEMWCKA